MYLFFKRLGQIGRVLFSFLFLTPFICIYVTVKLLLYGRMELIILEKRLRRSKRLAATHTTHLSVSFHPRYRGMIHRRHIFPHHRMLILSKQVIKRQVMIIGRYFKPIKSIGIDRPPKGVTHGMIGIIHHQMRITHSNTRTIKTIMIRIGPKVHKLIRIKLISMERSWKG